ncbi:MAG: Glu-tRNA(Gln) amidotransferase subunit GatE [Pseudomonadota bacterium]
MVIHITCQMEHSSIDYAEVGMIAGLEVHQQLLTERKMFCNCPAGLYTKDHDGEMLRHMRPTLSELGEYDGTALMEFKTKKNIIYLLHKSNVCTYEMDDTPPFLVNQQSLDVAMEQCLMLGCDIVDEVHVARKQYLDGSIPTGFQRTAIVGVNGRLPFMGRELSITQVSVEEDSCREVSDKGHLIVWRTDRLGMPLIETVTGPDLRTPEEVVEAILLVGRVCRSTGHVRVGMGASRQDVNVSVRGGRRVEIKGVPQAWWARGLVHGEAVRQVNLLGLRSELHGRGFKKPEDFVVSHMNVTSLCQSSRLSFLHQESWDRFVAEEKRRPAFELGKGPFCVLAVKLTGLAGTLGWPTQPDHIFANELAGRVRVIAGLDQQPILLHSEKWPDYGDSQRELRRIKTRIGCGPRDSMVIVWGPREDTITAAEEIRLRYVDAIDGIPNETRQPFPDGSTDFERILPGPDRMYPDTDSPPTRITRERVEGLKVNLPPPPWVREKLYGRAGVPRNTIFFLIRRGGAALVDLVAEKCGADLRKACYFFGERLKGLRRRGVAVHAVTPEKWCELFQAMAAQPVMWEAWQQLVSAMSASPEKTAAQIVEEAGLNADPAGWEQLVRETVGSSRPDHKAGTPDKLLRFYMGRIMPKLRGRVPAADVGKVLDTMLQQAAGT